MVDQDTRLRIDVFRAFGSTLQRTSTITLAGQSLRLISLEDLVARMARLALGVTTPAKFVVDFLRLSELTYVEDVETAWREQRKPGQTLSLQAARNLLRSVFPQRQELLITPRYSMQPDDVCLRCVPFLTFPLADSGLILSMLGYC